MEAEELQEKMKAIEQEFNALNDQINKTVEDYNSRITALQEEGNAKVADLQNQREQKRGAYMAYLELYNGIAPVQQPSADVTLTPEPVVEEPVVEEPVVEEPEEPVAESVKLTPEEIEKVSKVATKKASDTAEIPEYLQAEYDKK